MRRCLFDDLLAGSERLAIERAELRPALAAKLIDEAHAAHRYTKRFGRPHPRWGNGSLMTRALMEGPFQPRPLCHASLSVMAAAIDGFHRRQACAHRGLSSNHGL